MTRLRKIWPVNNRTERALRMTQEASSPHYAALVTPFDDDGGVDEKACHALCEHLAQVSGISGLVVNANAGEVDALTQEERCQLVRAAARVASQAGIEVVAGLAPTPSSFAGAAANAGEFRDAGADSLLVLGPTAFGRGISRDPGLAGDYISHIYQACQIPIIYFLAGLFSGIDYTPEVIAEICRADGVVALKDTMWSTEGFAATKAIAATTAPDVRVLTGNDNCVLSTMIAGAEGTLLILNSLVGSEVVGMHRALRTYDLESALDIDARIRPLVDVLFQNPMLKMASRVKAALHMAGVLASPRTRLPVPQLRSSELAELESAMRASGLV